MIPKQRQRAGAAVRQRMDEQRLTVPKLAEKAEISTYTVRALLRGDRWPSVKVQGQVENALGWHPGELARRAVGSRPVDAVADMPTHEVLQLLAACCTEMQKRFGPGS